MAAFKSLPPSLSLFNRNFCREEKIEEEKEIAKTRVLSLGYTNKEVKEIEATVIRVISLLALTQQKEEPAPGDVARQQGGAWAQPRLFGKVGIGWAGNGQPLPGVNRRMAQLQLFDQHQDANSQLHKVIGNLQK